jgi:hypothetical protein
MPNRAVNRSAEAIVICLSDDVCLTPRGSAMVPARYRITGRCDQAINTSPNVNYGNKPAFTMASRLPSVEGNPLGVGGGMLSKVNLGFCRPVQTKKRVRVNGHYIVCNDDLMHMNCAGSEGPYNTIGRVVYVMFTSPTGKMVLGRKERVTVDEETGRVAVDRSERTLDPQTGQLTETREHLVYDPRTGDITSSRLTLTPNADGTTNALLTRSTYHTATNSFDLAAPQSTVLPQGHPLGQGVAPPVYNDAMPLELGPREIPNVPRATPEAPRTPPSGAGRTGPLFPSSPERGWWDPRGYDWGVFADEFGKGASDTAADMITFGGYSGVQRRIEDGTIGSTGIVNAGAEGIFNTITLGGGEAAVNAYGDGQGLGGIAGAGGKAIVEDVLPIGEIGAIFNPATDGWGRAQAIVGALNKGVGLVGTIVGLGRRGRKGPNPGKKPGKPSKGKAKKAPPSKAPDNGGGHVPTPPPPPAKKKNRPRRPAEGKKKKYKKKTVNPDGSTTYRMTDKNGREFDVTYDADGYPDMTPFKYQGSDGLSQVDIDYTGNRPRDFSAANERAGFSSTPDDYVWHHHQNGKTMQLVDRAAHEAIPHTGGFSNAKH